MSNQSRPSDRVAVVTGASSGIGEAIARLLARKGWHCVLVARREDRLRALAEEIGGEVELCDVADRDAVDAMAERILARHPAIHLLVNNAGMPARGSYLTVDLDLVRRVMEVNYLGGVWCTRALLPGLRAAASGTAHVVNLVSVAGTTAFAPAGRLRRVEARPARVLALPLVRALAEAASRCTRSCPDSSRPRASRRRTSSRAGCMGRFVIQPPQVAEAVLRCVEKGKREVTVPWFPYRPISILQALAPGRHRPVREHVGLQARLRLIVPLLASTGRR